MKPVPSRKKRISQSGGDSGLEHRSLFAECPYCSHKMERDKDNREDPWDEAAVTLVLEPKVFKSGCVSIVSECPKCFELSWVHHRMSGFSYGERWPGAWMKAVQEREATVKLEALRQWGAGLCHGCRHLKSGTIEHHAWRQCIVGSGPAVKECKKYEPL